ncbi:hypothetical protein BC739_007037 [Kutzneria viridogrisea]|uniref:Uncharacterized protein n=2 Tax=Kutzneria TaxID=43356 RepID=W5W0U0_9PSEU|nr:hypothetical protein KALB_757 [Kutzneria albida DSM 43870]MBA8929804.1 hypothetical protein [Kutzneria viridogrisea]
MPARVHSVTDERDNLLELVVASGASFFTD